MAVISELRRLRQEDHPDFKSSLKLQTQFPASVNYKVRSHFKEMARDVCALTVNPAIFISDVTSDATLTTL